VRRGRQPGQVTAAARVSPRAHERDQSLAEPRKRPCQMKIGQLASKSIWSRSPNIGVEGIGKGYPQRCAL